MTSLEPIGLFLVYFGVALAFQAVFIALYMAVHGWRALPAGHLAH